MNHIGTLGNIGFTNENKTLGKILLMKPIGTLGNIGFTNENKMM